MSQEALRRFAVAAASMFLAACSSTPGGLVALDGGDDSGSDAYVTVPDTGGPIVRDAAKPDGGCADGVKDSNETDVDCGGATCGACPAGEMCLKNADCQSDICTAGVCQQEPPPQQCKTLSDCPGADTLCQTASCVSNACVYTPASAGTTCNDDGGSKCDGSGHCIACMTASDCPASTSACVINACVSGACVANAATIGTTCTDSGGTECNGSGKCVAQCTSPSDCPASTTVCAAPACNGGLCGSTDATAGTTCTDSGGTVCDGNGSCVACNTGDDCPAQATVCVTNTCTAGVCGTTNAASGTACTDSGGSVCSASGSCVACNSPSDCPATGNFCIAPACTANVCGTADVSNGTALPAGDQTAGDCQKIVCDGAGATTSVDDATDLPTPTTVCETNPACTGTPLAPSFTPAATGTSCIADNDAPKQVCGDTTNATIAGTCVECNNDLNCVTLGALTCDTATGTCN